MKKQIFPFCWKLILIRTFVLLCDRIKVILINVEKELCYEL